MRDKFQDIAFKAPTLELIEFCNGIIAEYQTQGFTLTLRQLYYQCVARDRIPNKQTEYKRLGSIINDARLAGLVDWSAIEDRTRNVRRPNTWDDPAQILEAVASQYKGDLWKPQRWQPEVWIEKDALVGVIEPVCERMRVPYFACRGYTSQSEAYAAGQRFAKAKANHKKPIVLHLGDHDPSGVDMTRDNEARLHLFARHGVTVRRLALTIEQIDRYRPPPNPAKDTDSRHGGYAATMIGHGYDADDIPSWELDALDPTVIDQLIQRALDDLIDKPLWEEFLAVEADERELLAKLSSDWDDVADFLKGRSDD